METCNTMTVQSILKGLISVTLFHYVPDEEDCEDLFLSCNELGEDETMIDDN